MQEHWVLLLFSLIRSGPAVLIAMSSTRELHQLYAQRMMHHGTGYALFTPVSSRDLIPPCCGFFDRNGDWNLVTQISHDPAVQRKGFLPLREKPRQVTEVSIIWRPKTSTGVKEDNVSANADTPQNLAVGANAQIKYSCSDKFGAILIARHPVTMRAYHQEPLFATWLDDNRRVLHEEYGTHLRKYGMWVVTKAYSAPGCSINAWVNDDKQAVVSMKAKASMLGELGEELSMEEKVMDKDWSHYQAKEKGEGVVMFVDGIDTGGSEWHWERLRQTIPSFTGWRSSSRSRSTSARAPMKYIPPKECDSKDFDAETTFFADPEKPTSRYLNVPAAPTPHDLNFGLDEEVPPDAGPLHLSKGSSVRRASSAVSSLSSRPQSRSPSLRRETRSISEKDGFI